VDPSRADRLFLLSAPCSLFPQSVDWLNYIQWPAMLVTVGAAWGTASSQQNRRRLGFWLFLASNVLWVTWGWYARAWALILLQVCLAVMNIRGANNNETEEDESA
jgi:hypothetical protein